MANRQSSSNLNQAIAIAKMVPSGTEAYQSAQSQIQTWQRILTPPPPPPRVQPQPPRVQQPTPPRTNTPVENREQGIENQEQGNNNEIPSTLELEEPEMDTEVRNTEPPQGKKDENFSS